MNQPPCPHLPAARPGLDWRFLNAHRDEERGGAYYRDCLEYGQDLWMRGLAARALLCMDRAFGADLRGDEPELTVHPLPYAATAWILDNLEEEVFTGNPRVHFQHYAGRMNEPRREQRTWRAWACWALTRVLRPALPGDPRHAIQEPTLEEIGEGLRRFGLAGEAALWRKILEELPPR